MTANSTDMERTDDQDDGDNGWEPEPAALREGETTDVSSHAARNIAQIRQAARDGDLSEQDAADAARRIRARDEEEQG